MNPRPSLADLPARVDLLIIGGGITGAGIFNEAARGLRAKDGARPAQVLLVEQNDFASGTSSASSKLVHGGLRYLKSGQWRLTLESVRERNRLLRQRAGLVARQPFLMPIYAGMKPGRAVMRAGLAVYDAMSGQFASRGLSAAQTLALEPELRRAGLLGAVAYDDAQTDDAGLTLRLLMEARSDSAQVLNYTRVEQVLSRAGRVHGVALRDALTGATREIEAGLVINAAGVGSGALNGAPDGAPMLRPLRGSHLIFPLAKLPVKRAVSWLHPRDRRPIFVYPWLGIALFGTTDLDDENASAEPSIQAGEIDYLFEGLAHQFPDLPLSRADVIASYSGLRPIVAGGKADPSAESRESASWSSPGWIGITGGKLTTFRVTARQVLREAQRQLPGLVMRSENEVDPPGADARTARYGGAFASWLDSATAADHLPIAGTPYLLGELRWAARHEAIVHLDDLLLRRTRCGLLLAEGAAARLDDALAICRDELAWDEARCAQERARYCARWQRLHAVPS